ncbi:unnamed protein product [Darwinula stevensoni]|uniref:Uncharacterized protein n=1 Tax=Darwinula stevensoni TaxID=69355 RepID=A0A7R9FPF5_9CRUS|nr:unnamed protein product [Darwinula stevensoni]CAG0897533.1 unnamed protein product [Darwinula stevensoni]
MTYQLNCRENLSKTGVPCQQQCVHAIITLSTFAEGFDYLHCKCEGNLCQKSQDRINRCLPNIVQLNRTDSIIPCEANSSAAKVAPSCNLVLDLVVMCHEIE